MAVEIAPGRPLVFTHIPKTAGTALIAALTAALHPAAPFTGYDRAMFGAFTDFDRLSAAAKRNLVLAPEDIPAGADVVVGHMSPATTWARFPDASRLTVLREPRSRVVSHWLFSRAHDDRMLRGWGGWSEYVTAARRPLVDYLADEHLAFGTDNLAARLLVYPHPLAVGETFLSDAAADDLAAAALDVLDRFDLVGVVEDPNLDRAISGWLGRLLTVTRVNESPQMRRGLQCDVAAECERAADLIAARSRVDAVLWDRVAGAVPELGSGEEVRGRIYRRAVDRYSQLSVASRWDDVRRTASQVATAVRQRGIVSRR